MNSKIELNQEISKCARCGYCRENEGMEICPVRSVLGFESSYARGKLRLADLCLKENKELAVKEMVKVFYQCTLCGNCSKHCPLKINTPKIMNELRHKFLDKYNPLHDPNVFKNLFSNLCQSPSVIGNLVAKKGRINPRIYLLEKNGEKYLFYSGCMNEFDKETLKSIFEIFNHLGFSTKEMKNKVVCCGLPLSEMGQGDILQSRISKNMNILNRIGVEKIIVNCPGCLYVFKEFCKSESGIDFIHLTEFLNDHIPPLSVSTGLNVTYHDPCILGRYLGIYEAPRQLIEKMGLILTEMPRAKEESLCCGGGTLSIMNPDFSKEISRLRVKEAMGTGASVLLTSCPLCKWNLSRGNGDGMNILEISELLAGVLKEEKYASPINLHNPEVGRISNNIVYQVGEKNLEKE